MPSAGRRRERGERPGPHLPGPPPLHQAIHEPRSAHALTTDPATALHGSATTQDGSVSHATTQRRTAREIVAEAQAEFPTFCEDLDALCR